MLILSIITLILSLVMGYQALGIYSIVPLIDLSSTANVYITILHVCVLKWSPILAFLFFSFGLCGVIFLHKDEDQYKFTMLISIVSIISTLIAVL